jgi:hypothetical protein
MLGFVCDPSVVSVFLVNPNKSDYGEIMGPRSLRKVSFFVWGGPRMGCWVSCVALFNDFHTCSFVFVEHTYLYLWVQGKFNAVWLRIACVIVCVTLSMRTDTCDRYYFTQAVLDTLSCASLVCFTMGGKGNGKSNGDGVKNQGILYQFQKQFTPHNPTQFQKHLSFSLLRERVS